MARVSYGAYDQPNVDRFARHGVYRFRFVPAWYAPWVERRGDEWVSEGAEARVREAFYDSLVEFGEGERADSEEVAARSQGLSQKSQEAALWLLQRDSRFWSSPEEFEIPGGRRLRPPLPDMDDAWFAALSDLATSLQINPSASMLQKWALAFRQEDSYAGGRASQPSSLLLCRSGIGARDLLPLVPLLSRLFGQRVVRIGPKTWADFPESLGPALARELAGAALVILEGLEDMRRFPEVALVRWLLSAESIWQGADGCMYCLPMPRCFMLAGRPLPRLPYVDLEVGERLFLVGGER